MNSFSFARLFAIIEDNMKKTLAFLLFAVALSGVSSAKVKGDLIECPLTNSVARLGWINVDDEHHLSGRALTPEDLNTRVVVVHRWCYACPNIEEGVKSFQQLAKRYADTDFVFLTSYYPGAAHPRQEVENVLDRLKVFGPVYIGAASIGVRVAREHRALYVAEGGTNEVWSLRINNTDIKSLTKYLDSHRPQLEEASLRLAAECAPGRALNIAKRLKKSDPKTAARLRTLTDPLNTPENRQMAEFEDKVDALFAKKKPSAKDAKALRIKLIKFAEGASPALKDEIEALKVSLNSIEG